MRSLVLTVLAVVLAACGGASSSASTAAPAAFDPADCERPLIEIRNQDDVHRISECMVITGSIVLSTGVDVSLRPLAGLERIDGDLRVGPTLALTAVEGMRALTTVGGSVEIDGNALLTTVSLTALRSVGGGITIHRNASLSSLASEMLAIVEGSVVIARNADLFLISLSALERVGGDFEVSGNGRLELFDAPALAEVGETLVIERNRALDQKLVEALIQRLAPQDAGSGEIAPPSD